MTRPVQPGSPTEGKSPELLPESETAYQIQSEGPLLQKEKSWGEWFLYVITFEWIWGRFVSAETVQPPPSPLLGNINKLFESAQSLLSGRIPKEEAQKIKEWLATQPSDWLVKFAVFLNEANLLEARKPDQYPLEKSEKIHQLFEPLLTEKVADNDLISTMLNEILFLTTVDNTQMIEDTLKPDERSKPYLFSLIKAPFALQFEIRTEERMLHITDPRTKATRTVVFDPNDSEENRHRALAEGIYLLSHPQWVVQSGYDAKQLCEEMKKGNIAYHEGHKMLTLFPSVMDLDKTGFFQGLINTVANKIIAGGEGEIKMPIATIIPQQVKIQTSADEGFYRVTLTYKNKSYTMKYPKGGKTRDEVVRRIRLDRTLERDLLLARAYFIRETL